MNDTIRVALLDVYAQVFAAAIAEGKGVSAAESIARNAFFGAERLVGR